MNISEMESNLLMQKDKFWKNFKFRKILKSYLNLTCPYSDYESKEEVKEPWKQIFVSEPNFGCSCDLELQIIWGRRQSVISVVHFIEQKRVYISQVWFRPWLPHIRERVPKEGKYVVSFRWIKVLCDTKLLYTEFKSI